MFQYCKITHLACFSFKCGLDIFFRNVASENSSHLSESRASQNAGFLSAKKAPKSHYTEEKGKENKKKAKRNEGEKRNSPCLGFFVFCFCFCFVFFVFVFFHCLYFGDGFHHSGPTMIRTISWESQTGIPKIRPLKISSHLTKLRPNHEIILV